MQDFEAGFFSSIVLRLTNSTLSVGWKASAHTIVQKITGQEEALSSLADERGSVQK